MVFSSDFPILMSLFCWFAWRAHRLEVLLAPLYFYVVHVFCSEPEVPSEVAYLVSEAPMPQSDIDALRCFAACSFPPVVIIVGLYDRVRASQPAASHRW